MGSFPLPPPGDRSDFRVAIICALPREADAVFLLFDHFWGEEGLRYGLASGDSNQSCDLRYGRAEGDGNQYTTGRIGQHDVVVAILSSMGTLSAAAATASLRSSYSGLRVALLVGICGAVPKICKTDVMLGDVIISKSIVQYDYGRQYPGHFERRRTLVGRGSDLHSLLSAVTTTHKRRRLQAKASEHLKHLQRESSSTESQNRRRRQRVSYQYPGSENDKLYRPDYTHKHERCRRCRKGYCESAEKASCAELGCESSELVSRNFEGINDYPYQPEIFIGRVGSANTVMKSAQHRDQIAKEHKLIAFEMEGAGIWDQVPCLIIKGVCDYADSHKNDKWQDFAAATAASVMKAVLESYHHSDKNDEPAKSVWRQSMSLQPFLCHTIPYAKNLDIVERQQVVEKLNTVLSQTTPYSVAALWGSGGSGKTQIALQYAYQRWEARNSFVFWVHGETEESFMHDYKNIAQRLNMGRALKGKQLLEAVCNKIESLLNWVLIIDNANDLTLFRSEKRAKGKLNLESYIPRSARESGTVIWTSYDQKIVGTLVGQEHGVEITGMTNAEAWALLGIETSTMTAHERTQADVDTQELFKELDWLALAISQAGIFMRRTERSVGEYLCLLRNDSHRWKVLKASADAWDQKESQMSVSNSVLGAWLLSINQIFKENMLAHHILHVLSYVDNQNISDAMIVGAARYYQELSPYDEGTRVDYARQQYVKDDDYAGSIGVEIPEAIGRLREYSFIRVHREGEGKRSYEIQRLVQDAAHYGLRIDSLIESKNNNRRQIDQRRHNSEAYFSRIALKVISDLYPRSKDNARHQAEKYLAHAMRVIKHAEVSRMPNCTASLIDRLREFILGRVINSEQSKLTLAERALELRRKGLGDRHEDTLFSRLEVARSLYDIRNYVEAENEAEQLYYLQKKVLGKTNPHTIQTLLLEADAIFAQNGRQYEAEELLINVIRSLRHAGVNSMMLGHAIYHRACMRDRQGDRDTALRLALRAMNVLRECAPSPYYIWCMRLAADIYMERKNYSKAVSTLQDALAHSQQVLGTDHRTTIGLKILLAFSYLNLARYDNALKLAKGAERNGKRMFGANDRQTIQAQSLRESIEFAQRRADNKPFPRNPSSNLNSPSTSAKRALQEEYRSRLRVLLSRAAENLGYRLSILRDERFASPD